MAAGERRRTEPEVRRGLPGRGTSGTCCPGVSEPCYGHADGATLPEQFTGNAWRSMLEQLRTGSLHVPLRLGHDGPEVGSTRGLDLLFTSHAVYGLEFEARLRDTPECRKVLERITTTQCSITSSTRSTTPRPGAVYRMAFTEGRGTKERNRRREAVVNHLVAWSPLTILAQQADGGLCLIWFVISRPVAEAAVREFVKECPHYVAKSFKRLG